MTLRTLSFAALASLALSSFTLAASAQNAAQPPLKTIGKTQAAKSSAIPSLAVLNSDGASLKDGVLTMSGIAQTSIIFADRPVRAAGHVLTADFIKRWADGKNSFASDPPNATISVFSKDGAAIEDAVVVLKKPVLQGDTLTFEVSVLESGLQSVDGAATLFIDAFAVRGPGGGVAVGNDGHVDAYGHVGYDGDAWHGADYGNVGYYAHPAVGYGAAVAGGAIAGAAVGTAIGAAAAAPYYAPPACGYYPLPPC
ncbi:hypothetical protein DK847_13635 [Aestuariivirga litoralis]|uniref:Uncharacterized protein n=1 Tax=Aestuariivirga litoralis TaxID=2650924 RepID=A0A2W2BK14_9HYPH|nr:hypothetical protein [Aestuariivirga litoralis]PZF76237.1 hypothetical protein DK847_13635 [Aestuariivirga litoralis]